MKYIEIDDELYQHIASNTQRIGESASDILRRLLGLTVQAEVPAAPKTISEPSLEPKAVAEPTAPVRTSAPVRSAVAEAGVFEELLVDDLLDKQKGAVGRFIYLLDSVYRQYPSQFDRVLQIRGRDRLYFSNGKEALLKASKTANPKQIGSSPYWVSANNNTKKKQTILEEVLKEMGCQAELAAQIAQRI
ncbi:replication initiation negative regulator SeqA [Ferrimonas marina]|uniref:Negative modulator of initiation of replication n=1 Tax=Ferrimonas marina TaxID=299255 RepID=A0A1M5Z3T6_9GAMM|nr:replication initiation negative regulator SeqA [Ferrimonas marina]SHI18778.1 negative regulator of replication initiation SeqA [Ferrimonas marina]